MLIVGEGGSPSPPPPGVGDPHNAWDPQGGPPPLPRLDPRVSLQPPPQFALNTDCLMLARIMPLIGMTLC